MVTHVTLIQETRGTDFVNATGEAPVLGQYIATDYNSSLSFGLSGDAGEEGDEISWAEVVFRMPFPMAQKVLPRSERPQERVYFWQVARYAQIHIGYTNPKTWLIEGAIIEEIGADLAKVTLRLEDPLAWVSKYPTLVSNSLANLSGNRNALLESLTTPLSDRAVDLEGTGKALPIIKYDASWVPSADLITKGYVSGNAVALPDTISIANPYPLAVTEAITTVLSGWSDGLGTYGLTVIEVSDTRGPYWRWVLWKHKIAEQMYTLAELNLQRIETNSKFTDVLTYDEDNQQDHRYLGGPRTLANPYLNGAWLGVEFKSFKKPSPDAPLPPGKPPTYIENNFGNVGTWGPGSGTGASGIGPGPTAIEGNTVIPTPDGLVTPGGLTFNDTIDPRDVSFLVNTADRTYFDIPFTAAQQGHVVANVDIFVDGQLRETFSLTAAILGKRVTLPGDNADHVITLKPAGGNYAMGWCYKVGYYSQTTTPRTDIKQILALGKENYRTNTGLPMNLANQWYRCTELTRVANPDSYFDSVQPPGNFEYYRFGHCVKLEVGPEPAGSFTFFTGTIPANFRNLTYQNCVSLKKLPNIMPWLEATAIGNNYYAQWCQNANQVRFPQAFQLHQKVKTVGDNFFYQMFELGSSGEIAQDRTPPESLRDLLPEVETIGNNFMAFFKNGISGRDHVAERIVFPLMPKVKTIGNRAFYFYGSRSKNSTVGGVAIDDMPSWPLLETVGGEFMYSFASDSDVKVTMRESILASLTTFGIRFMGNAYSGCQSVVSYLPEQFPPNFVGTTLPDGYRSQCYAFSISPTLQSNPSFEFIETSTKNMTKGATYRDRCFRGNGYSGGVPTTTNPKNQRVRYSDGIEVVMGVNGIPSTFYG